MAPVDRERGLFSYDSLLPTLPSCFTSIGNPTRRGCSIQWMRPPSPPIRGMGVD